MLFRLNYFFISHYKLYLHSDSIHHGYLNKTGIVTVIKFNMNMATENKKIQNLKTMWF